MIQFILRKTKDCGVGSLSVRVLTSSLNTKVSLGYRIPFADWSDELKIPKRFYETSPSAWLGGKSYADLTELINKIRCRLDALCDIDTATNDDVRSCVKDVINGDEKAILREKAMRVDLFTFIDNYIKDLYSGKRTRKGTVLKVKESTVVTYKNSLASLRKYAKDKQCVLDFDDITCEFIGKYRAWLMENNFALNSISNYISNIRRIMKLAYTQGVSKNIEYLRDEFCTSMVDVENVYLTEEMIDDLFNTNFDSRDRILELAKKIKDKSLRAKAIDVCEHTKYKYLQQARDIFLVGCFTGQRVSDYARIKASDIVKLNDNKDYILVKQKKTGKDVYIPLDPRVRIILMQNGGKLPDFYLGHMNERIKKIGLLMGWTHDSGIAPKRSKLVRLSTKKRFYECLGTHTARRTFATLAYAHHISLQSIMAVTGHSSEDCLRRYLKLDSKETAILAAKEFDSYIGVAQ